MTFNSLLYILYTNIFLLSPLALAELELPFLPIVKLNSKVDSGFNVLCVYLGLLVPYTK